MGNGVGRRRAMGSSCGCGAIHLASRQQATFHPCTEQHSWHRLKPLLRYRRQVQVTP